MHRIQIPIDIKRVYSCKRFNFRAMYTFCELAWTLHIRCKENSILYQIKDLSLQESPPPSSLSSLSRR